MLGDKRAFAAGQLIEFVLPGLQLLLELGERAATGLARRAAAPSPAAAPVLPAQLSHPNPQRGDLLLGANEGAKGRLGAAGLALGVEWAGDDVGHPLAPIPQPHLPPPASHH